jgi:hypothetical protein
LRIFILMESYNIIAIKGDHTDKDAAIFSEFGYIDRNGTSEINNWNQTLARLYDTNYEMGTRFITHRAIWKDGDWTMIYDPEMRDVFNEQVLEHLSTTFNTIILTFVAQIASRTYSFAKYKGKKERELFLVNGEPVRSVGSPLPEESSLQQKDDLVGLALNFRIHLDMKSTAPYTLHRLNYSDELKQELFDWENQDKKKTVPGQGNFVLFRKFRTLEETYPLVELLREKNIPYQIVDNSFAMDLTFGNTPQTDKELKLLKKDFTKVDLLLEELAKENIKNLPQDHYLYQFSDEELIEVVEKSDEWSKEDHLLAQQILASKGKTYSKQKLDSIKEERIKDLSKPEGGDGLWTVLGYLFAICGGLLGTFIGWHLMSFKKVLPNGDRVFNYRDSVRADGKRIFFISIAVILLEISALIYYA